MEEYLAGLFERATTPVSEEKPCGENARYDARYDKVKTEIMKLTAGPSGINWGDVSDNIDELFQQETKDLTLAAYLCLALLKQHQYNGLLTGLKIIESFLDTWWDSMFPPAKRLKARVQIFEWMDDRLSALVHVTEPTEEEADALRQCKAVMDTLPQKVQDLVKSQVTGFSQLRTEINQWVGNLPEDKPQVSEEAAPEEPEEEKSEAAESSPEQSPAEEKTAEEKKEAPPKDTSAAPEASPTKAPAPAKKIDLPQVSEEDLENMDAGVKAILNIVEVLRKIDPLAAISYRLSRILKWELVQEAPVAELDGKTKLMEPHRQRLDILRIQLSAGNWSELVKTAENMFVTGDIFFIDLQRYVYQSLLSQGAEPAAEAVKMESGKFLNRIPELLDLTYSSGMPMADQETRQWAGEAMKAVVAGSGNEGMETESDTLKEAKQAAVKNLSAALPKLQDAISEATNTKNQMRTQLEVAKLFVDNREYPWAMPILRNLYAKIDTVKLVEWAPEFCVDVWELMLRGYNALPDMAKSGTEDVSRNEIGQKLFSLNVARAAALTPRDKKK